jgi:hypothetical protein
VDTSRESKITLLGTEQVKCDRTVCNKQGIIVRDNGRNVYVNSDKNRDRNVIKKDAERILKYKSFKTVNVACKTQ